MKKKVLIAMSGGVDSSVAAYLLQREGYDCIGCTMKLYENADIGLPKGRTCCSLSDVEDARSVAYRLHIPYYVFNFADRFRREVMERFAAVCLSGGTPNPCIDCNRYLKFGELYRRAELLGCGFVATGHYAGIVREDGLYRLIRAADRSKDQSYVLYALTQRQLAHTLFPLGGLTKTEVRAIAAENGFLNAEKPDSQDICFVPDGDYAGWVERTTGRHFPEGAILDRSGRELGRHHGAIRYTIGQRKGLGVAAERPLYVIGKDMEANTVTVGFEPALYQRELTASDVNWIGNEPPPSQPIRCTVMTRYRGPERQATVTPGEDKSIGVVFDEPQRAVTPGQAAVLYDGDTVLGGGTIRA